MVFIFLRVRNSDISFSFNICLTLFNSAPLKVGEISYNYSYLKNQFRRYLL